MSPHVVTSLPEPRLDPPAAWVEVGVARTLAWRSYTLPVGDLPPALDGLRVLHLSDLHAATRWQPAWSTLLDRVVADLPDLILFTGDFVDCKTDHRPALPTLHRFFNGLRARLGVWAILGNHDTDLLPLRYFDDHVRRLDNAVVRLTDGDAAIELVGHLGVGRDDANVTLSPKPANTLRLVLSHVPGGVENAPDADAVFAGHTHGGQICLPGGVPIVTHDPMPRRYARRVHRFGDTYLIVNRGLGFSTYPLRLFCPAEAIEVTFNQA